MKRCHSSSDKGSYLGAFDGAFDVDAFDVDIAKVPEAATVDERDAAEEEIVIWFGAGDAVL